MSRVCTFSETVEEEECKVNGVSIVQREREVFSVFGFLGVGLAKEQYDGNGLLGLRFVGFNEGDAGNGENGKFNEEDIFCLNWKRVL